MSGPGDGIVVLVVEDNAVNRELLVRRLTRAGFTIREAVDGEDAVRAVEGERPDVVLMDLGLPILDGWDATRRIKANPATADVPVIALTARAMSGDEATARAAGCDAYATKPVDFPALVGLIGELVRGA